MDSPTNSSRTERPVPFMTDAQTPRQPVWFKVAAVLSACAVTAALFAGYTLLHQRQAQRAQTLTQTAGQQQPAPAASPQVLVLQDEARLKGTQAILGGTVRNLSPAPLADLHIELELRRRASGALETRLSPLQPSVLEPGAEGRFSLFVTSREWSGSRVVRVLDQAHEQAIAFKLEPGTRRPPERTTSGGTKVVVVPRPRTTGDGFINTPDTPIAIP